MTDHYTGFTWGQTCEDKVADNLVNFVHSIFVKDGFGPPEIILTDNGKEVSNKLIKSMIL